MTGELKDEDRIRHMLEAALKAAGKISESFRQSHPEIPWNRVTGIRNRLIHGYFDVDLDIVWQTVTGRLPELIAQLKKFVA